MSTMKKFSAVLEVLGVYAAGQLLGFLFASLLGVPLQNPLQTMSADPSATELRQITLQLLLVLFFQYAGWFLLIIPLGLWRGWRRPADYGMSLAGNSIRYLLLSGVILFAFAELPTRLVEVVNHLIPLGEQAAWRETISRMDWSSLEFWLLMAVGSFGLIPIVEELFYRGYCQTRLEQGLGAPAAILATACLFAFSHSQYLILNTYNLLTLLALLFSAISWGYIYYRTRSLLPVMAAHALVNIPVRGAVSLGLPVAMLIICFIARREIAQHLRELMRLVKGMRPYWQASLAIAACAFFAIGFGWLGDSIILAGLVFFIAALVLIWLEKRQARKTAGSLQE